MCLASVISKHIHTHTLVSPSLRLCGEGYSSRKLGRYRRVWDMIHPHCSHMFVVSRKASKKAPNMNLLLFVVPLRRRWFVWFKVTPDEGIRTIC